MNKRVLFLSFFMFLIAQAIKLMVEEKPIAQIDIQDETRPATRKTVKKEIPTRTPASIQFFDGRRNEGPLIVERNRDQFHQGNPQESAPEQISNTVTTGGYVPMAVRSFPQHQTRQASSLLKQSTNAKTDTDNIKAISSINGSTIQSAQNGTQPTIIDPSVSKTPSPSTSYTPPPEVFTCDANLGSGSFKNPIQVTLSCSNTANLRYCLSEGVCCDPNTGANYVSSIPVGQSAKTYCLSFVGENSKGKASTITQKTYTFTPTTPDLLVNHEQKYFQTTQLNALLSIASDDFGKRNHAFGLINLYNHEPNTNGLTTCEEIVSNYGSLLSPIPKMVVPETPLHSYDPSQQLDLFLGKSKLQYGDNWLTTYLSNDDFDQTTYACTTSNIRLEDFIYFQSDVSFTGNLGSNEIREFSGTFAAYGPFDSAPNPFRAPAGQGGSHRLESGLFGIFY